MRTTGNSVQVARLAPHDHVSWSYDDPSTFVAAATAFLAEGTRLGERVGYIGGVGLDHMREVLDGLAGGIERDGATFVADLGSMYQGGAPDPEEQVDIYVRATRSALSDGFRGLRVAADATAMASTPEAAAAFARYEHLIDQAMVDMPFSAMCGFDVTVVGEHARRLACLHPVTNDPGSTFGVFGSGGGSVGLRGELDRGNIDAFADALEQTGWPTSALSTVDATSLDFIDHRALQLLQRRLDGADAAVVLRCRSSVVSEMVDLLDLDRIDAEVAR